MKYVNVVVDNNTDKTDTFYTYRAPDEIVVGDRVTVRFANRKKDIFAYVVEDDVIPECAVSRIKTITGYDKSRSLNSEMIDTAMWMRRRYGVKYIDAIKMFTVGGVKYNDSTSSAEIYPEAPIELSDDQKNAIENINRAIDDNKSHTILLKGVTNSGKTEVYMRAVDKVLSQGKTAIVLLPEIALSGQTELRFKRRFGDKAVATLHSKLTTRQKLTEWMRIRSGEARIVVGARTAVFAPLEDIGIIVIDEEHEGTYKSDHNPKYETVDVAFKRCKTHGALLLLGTATPSITSYYRSRIGLYELVEMPHRIGDSILPEIEIVDMRQEVKSGNIGVISRRLAQGIDNALASDEQIILFLNRRGFSTQILCPDCGHKMTCDECGISLTYHKSINAAVCHYCGRKFPLPESCPECGSKYIKYIGAGTEKVEESVKLLWPDVPVERFDLDTATSKAEIDRVIKNFQSGKTRILVGTQILAKGLDFNNVGLVGIINADVSLNIPDYRSGERTYQLITQVAGRAGRRGGSSRVIIQTYEPESDIIIDAAAGDYNSFFETELNHRNIMNYPPYSDLISISFVEKKDNDSAMRMAEAFREQLRTMKNAPEDAVILRAREEQRHSDGNRRVSFIIKAPLGSRSGYINAYMKHRDRMIENSAPCYIEIDVNPYGII